MAITVSPYLHNEELIEEGEENSVDVFHLQNLQRTFSRSILIQCGALLLYHELH
jgi:hypothetical protein